ncbi:MAG TPA: AAA domain-containing protein [Herpetosiphonaceae bacterium]
MIDQLAPTAISQFIRLDACQRFLYFTLHPDTAREMRERYGARPRPLSPLLRQAGAQFEREVVDTLRARYQVVDLADGDTDATVDALRQVGREPVILAQAALDGEIGAWRSAGRADLIEAIRDKHGRLHVLIADVKASREERLEHRVQVATYALLLTDLCRRAELPLIRIVGAIVHRTPTGGFTTLHDPALHFELGPYQTLVLDLIAGEDGALSRAAQATLGDLPFALNALCDGCKFSSICLPHAAERADLALVSDISRAVRSALYAHEIRDLWALAALKQPDAAGKLQPAPEHADRIALLLRDPVIAPHLDHLIARSRAVLRRLDPTLRAPSRLPDYHASSLPDPAAHPDLLQLFLDFQADDVTGDLYLASALLLGAAGERMVTRMSDAPPTAASETLLLRAWASDLEAAIRELASSDAPPLHVLVYDRRAQRIALEACARHEQHHALLGVLVAWLQERPQIERATCAQLREVISQQRNLRLTCDSLYAVATEVWDEHGRFSWKTPDHDFTRLFRGGLFDSVQRFVRDADGLRVAPMLAQESISLESVSRFSSQIPSEYAYAVWNDAPNRPTRAELLAFAEHRLRALAHLAGASRRQRNLDVPLLPLDQLPTAAGPRDLRSALVEFLELEHVAALAELLAHVRLPIARRVLTGRTALLEAIAVEPKGDPPLARFRFAAHPGSGAVPPRFKVGDWAVLNEAIDGLSPWEIIKGRLVIVSAIDEETIEVELTALSSAGRFKFHHDSKLHVQLRCRYTLDEMADDLLGDRVLQALDHLDTNPLARWLQAPQSVVAAAPFDEATLVEAADALIALHAPAVPTEAQRAVIATGGLLALRLVQGPPGSGKSRTLGLAVVARLLAAAMQGRGLRVAVTAKTHSAVQVALDSIARAWQTWNAAPGCPPGQAPLLPLADLPIVKLGGSSIAPRARGVRWADPRKGAKDLRALIGGAVVVGGTPGGLGALLETTQRKARWEGLFDLLLIDEASQMSLPEGLLAASTLHERGQMIVVGDHRQMPPIIVHAWAEAVGTLAAWSPERSLFKWLLDAAAPCVALDESFRLHRDQARFLHETIYHADGIVFHSRRTALLPPHRFADPLVAAALRWDVPLVVIQHTERGSRQSNALEAALVADLVRGCLQLGLDGRDGVGVVVPHRAQKAALRAQIPELADADSIDTVERFQGGERDVIIVACTASDPDYVSAEAEFLMDPQRLNVALSRARKKLIVVAAGTVFDALPIELPIFERATLWKRLRGYAAPHPLWRGTREGYTIQVMGPRTIA